MTNTSHDAVDRTLDHFQEVAPSASEFIDRLAQEGFYVAPLTPVDTPGARNTDPATSHKAANTGLLRRNTQRTLLLTSFYNAAGGLTDEEAMERAVGVSAVSEYAKRCSELRASGYIVDTGEDRKGNSGAPRIVSKITDKGRAAFEAIA